MNEEISLKEYIELKDCLVIEKINRAKEVGDLKAEHQREVTELRWRLSEIAINKAETSMTDRMEGSNNKFALLEKQSNILATKTEVELLKENMAVLQKIIYIGLGAVLLLEALSKFIIK